MKIGLLTYHAVANFGANLQALSTVRCLQRRNIQVQVINWQPFALSKYYERCTPQEQRDMHSKCIHGNLPLSRICRSNEDVAKLIEEEAFDAVIIGSDAVFSYIPLLSRIRLSRRTFLQYMDVTEDHDFPNPFWGCCFDNASCKLFALSASAQYLDIDRCLWFEVSRLRNALSKFRRIFVRDSWTQRIVRNLIDSDITVSPDPVFAFNDNVGEVFRKEEIIAKYGLGERYVILSFCSKLYSDAWYEELYQSLSALDIQVVNLCMPEGAVKVNSDLLIDVPLDPIEWYHIIKYSNGYIGQRMHPMIVALSNNVPFVVFDHYAYRRGKNELVSSKVWDILNRAELLNQYINVKRTEITPSDCIARLNSFDDEKAGRFVSEYAEKFQLIINQIISEI